MVVPSLFITTEWFVLGLSVATIVFYVIWVSIFKNTNDASNKLNTGPVYIKIWIAGILAASAVAGVSEQGFITRPSDPPGVEIWYGRWIAHALICPAFWWIASGIQGLSERRAIRIAFAITITSVAAIFTSISDLEETRWGWLIVGAIAYVAAMFLYLEKARGRMWARVYTILFTAAYVLWIILHEITGILSVETAVVVYAIHDVLFTMLLFLIAMEFVFPAAHVCCTKCSPKKRRAVCSWIKECGQSPVLV